MNASFRFVGLCVILAAFASAGRAEVPAAPAAEPAATFAAQVEAQWLSPEGLAQARGAPATVSSVKTSEDARGAVDGVKNGKWGMHTAVESNPWWQVDLGEVQPLSCALVFNRCDAFAERTSRLLLLLSDDGKTWREAYRHNGTVFYGFTDTKPLKISLDGAKARFVRIQLPGNVYLHLDEVEIFSPQDPAKNLALGKTADQSSTSQWSVAHTVAAAAQADYPVTEVLSRGRRLADDLADAGTDVAAGRQTLAEVEQALAALAADAPADVRRPQYLKARWAVRKLALANPLLDFDAIVFAKHAPTLFPHMSDQYYGWWSRPGGGIFILDGFKGDSPRVRRLTASLPDGSFLRPELSHDGKRILFAYCKFYPHVADVKNKVAKDDLPEDSFYHLYEMNIDGTGLRQVTRGRYDDFDGRYLPTGEIVFLSTRRGQAVQCTLKTAAETLRTTMPDSYVRCGGGPSRPVAVYTLHTMDSGGKNLRVISPFESFEWTPSIAADGRILYARWDYVDRNNMPYMKLWATNPDGTNALAVWGNFMRSPQCAFEAMSIPGSHKIVFTAGAHHSITGGTLAVLDPGLGVDGLEPITRLTPEVCFPESDGWPTTYYASPWPLSEKYYLAAWSNKPLPPHTRMQPGDKRNPPNAQGLYLYDAFRNLELLYRDPAISSLCPIPVRPRQKPPLMASTVAWDGPQEGKVLVQSVYFGLSCVEPGTVKRLRVVAVPAKVQPEMNTPMLGVTRDDPGKCVLGTVPVEEDGSAYFRVPSGVSIFFQALDAQGKALQTMRTVTYVQPGQTLSCLGCHDRRDKVPLSVRATASDREASKITPGPEGSWPLRFDRLVQPVLDKYCVSCHRPDATDKAAAKFDLTPAKAYQSLVNYGGKESVHDRVLERYREGRSIALECDAAKTPLTPLLLEGKGHYDVKLDADAIERLFTWMDTYGQHLGSFSAEQESRLLVLRKEWSDLLEDRR
jgi:hypothetical protein